MMDGYVSEQYQVDIWEILPDERHKPAGHRLTKFKCVNCGEALTEAELSSIRWASAPCKHADCLQ